MLSLESFIEKVSNTIIDVVGDQNVQPDCILDEMFNSKALRASDEEWWDLVISQDLAQDERTDMMRTKPR